MEKIFVFSFSFARKNQQVLFGDFFLFGNCVGYFAINIVDLNTSMFFFFFFRLILVVETTSFETQKKRQGVL